MSDPSNNDTAPSVLAFDPVPVIGPYFLGNSLNYLLMGALAVQTYIYWQNFEHDKKATKWLGKSANDKAANFAMGFATQEAWYFSVENWGNFAALGSGPWSGDVHVIAVGVVSAIVQIFYAVRLSTLRKSIITKLLTGLIVLLALAQSTAAIVGTALVRKMTLRQTTSSPNIYAQIAKIPTQFELLKLHPVYSFWLVASFVTDILIAGSMIWILYTSKNMTFTPTTNSLLDRLIINTWVHHLAFSIAILRLISILESVQTGIVTVACAGVTLVLFLKSTDTVYYGIPLYMLGKLYSNSLVATLNARKSPTRAGLWDAVELHLSLPADTASASPRDRTGPTSPWGKNSVKEVQK
ncbi:hypothetical protein GGX14DRAFT_394867 [Mycena pura]|uniref:DUF6534 domain-containing protein n=1 Tax=Mycena pura TaxID=153505 RepID=A0AAD6VE63_9AGAR|nr:hypothetical protein GGX14DRAFT_394867 [Mycena pura]